MEHMILPRRSHYTRSIIKRVLHIIVKVMVLVRNSFKYHPFPALMVTMIILGSIFYMTNERASLPFLGERGPSLYYDNGHPIAAEQYLMAKAEGNAAKMWEQYNEEFKQLLQQNGRSVRDDQNDMNMEMLFGQGFEDYEYITSTPLDDGSIAHMYVVELNLGSETRELPVTFVIDQEGKIALVSPPL